MILIKCMNVVICLLNEYITCLSTKSPIHQDTKIFRLLFTKTI